jgi:hypothetical protein
VPSEARPTAVMVRPARNIRTPAQARAEAQARREQIVAPSPADTTTNQVFEDENDDFGPSDEEMSDAFENTGSGAEDEDAEGTGMTS